MTASAPRVLFAIHQIGSGADGGIRSIGEMIGAAAGIEKHVRLAAPRSHRNRKPSSPDVTAAGTSG